MRHIVIITQGLLIIGGINWLLIGILRFNLLATLLGPGSLLVRIVYTLIGLSALYAISFIPRLRL